MPTATEIKRGGVKYYRTLIVGKGKHKKKLLISVVHKRGPRGGHTVAKEVK
jgi:hypothetical protein